MPPLPEVTEQHQTPTQAATRTRIAPSSIILFGAVFWAIPLLGLFVAQFIDVMLIIFLAILLSTFLSPVVNWMEKAHIHRGLSILAVYLIFAGLLYVIGLLALPLFVNETQKLIAALPSYLHTILGPLRRFGITVPTNIGSTGSGLLSHMGTQASGVAGQAVGIVMSVGTVLVDILAMLVMAFFLTVQKTFTADVATILIPPDYRQRWITILSNMGERMGHWVVGQLVVTVYYAVAFSIGLTLLHVADALSVGIITGVLEIIPFIGGFVGVILAILVAASSNPAAVIGVVILYLIVTNVEAHILVPNIYGRAVHLHPFLVIVALLLGARAFGLLGALIAVPLAAAMQVVVENLYIRDVVVAAEHAREQRPRISGFGWRVERPRWIPRSIDGRPTADRSDIGPQDANLPSDTTPEQPSHRKPPSGRTPAASA